MSRIRLMILATVGGFLIVQSPILPADPDADALQARVTQLEAEVKLLRERLAKLENDKQVKSSPDKPSDKQPQKSADKSLKITVIDGGWGESSTDDIRATCASAAQELTQYFPNRQFDPVSIRFDDKQGPMVVYGTGSAGERRVLLNSKDRAWAQFSYQFGHEMCHILCNYRESDNSNKWFEESLCETASLFVLRKMGQTWKTKPPYSNWKSYAESLDHYATQRIDETEKLGDLPLAQWYRRNEPALRQSAVDRGKNQVVATSLLPLLEKNPQNWEAIGWLNGGDPKAELSFKDHLKGWHERVPKNLKPFVVDVAALFEITVE